MMRAMNLVNFLLACDAEPYMQLNVLVNLLSASGGDPYVWINGPLTIKSNDLFSS